MSQPSRPRTRGAAVRKRRKVIFQKPESLEDRKLLAPYLPITPLSASFTAATTPTNADLGTVSIVSSTTSASTFGTAAPYVSVGELTPISQFGNDIVTIQAGPGGAFGNDIYAVSRGAGDNASIGAINQPGVIYRIDPATGKASVFFNLNSVIQQLEPGATPGNSLGNSTGLVNWYSITFDPEGYFDGRPSMFVSSVDRSDPNKNAIFRIGPDGSFMGAFVQYTNGQSASKFVQNPTAILVPPVQQQTFLRGLISAVGGSTSTAQNNASIAGLINGTTTAPNFGTVGTIPGNFTAVFFNANGYQPGQDISTSVLPFGVIPTNFTLGPIVGLTASNSDYNSPEYSAFTDFGTPAGGGIPASPGLSGVQGSNGELLIQPSGQTGTSDNLPAATTPFRRFQSISFDQYGYFSYGASISATSTTGGETAASLIGTTITPTYEGSVFVSDLATGLTVTITPLAPLPTTPITVPVQGPGTIGVTTDAAGNVVPIITNGNTTDGSNIGGRIVRILPDGQMTTFAAGFATNGAQDSSSFINSSLTITFSADGTTMYASDDNAIWQFKSVMDLASASSGRLVGLNDLQTLGVPYDGIGEAVTVVDTGVDGLTTSFRGRVAAGTNIYTGGAGNTDTAAAPATTGGTTGGAALAGGHGTPVAGVIAQFVPQATIQPIDVFAPFISGSSTTGGSGGGSSGGTASSSSIGTTSAQAIYNGLTYAGLHPYVQDPVRPGTYDRVVAAEFAFGTVNTWDSEGLAYRSFPQLVTTYKTQFHRIRQLGIAPIAAAGQFGTPYSTSTTGTAGGSTGATTTAGNGDFNGMSLPALINEVISVSGVYPFPFLESSVTPPTDPTTGVLPRPLGPVLLDFGLTLGGGSSSTPRVEAPAAPAISPRSPRTTW